MNIPRSVIAPYEDDVRSRDVSDDACQPNLSRLSTEDMPKTDTPFRMASSLVMIARTAPRRTRRKSIFVVVGYYESACAT
jgi:hypothetical protein